MAFVLNELAEGSYEIYIMLGKGLLQRRHEIKEKLNGTSINNLLHINIAAPSLEDAENLALERVRSILL
jgi:hypothetical protein